MLGRNSPRPKVLRSSILNHQAVGPSSPFPRARTPELNSLRLKVRDFNIPNLQVLKPIFLGRQVPGLISPLRRPQTLGHNSLSLQPHDHFTRRHRALNPNSLSLRLQIQGFNFLSLQVLDLSSQRRRALALRFLRKTLTQGTILLKPQAPSISPLRARFQ